MINEFSVSSERQFQVIDINSKVEEAVSGSGMKEGLCVVYVPHATAAIIINENYDPNIGTDLMDALDKAVPLHAGYMHDKVDNNAAAHIKAAIIGPSETIIVKDGRLMLGTWQDVCLADFDGPKDRKVYVKIIEG